MDQLDLTRMRQSADRAVELMKVLGNPERMMLVCQIAQGERNVGELESELGIRQPTLSQQLAVLRRADVVETRREGKQIYYRVSSPEALRVIETLYALYCLPDGAVCEPKVDA